MQTPAKKDRYKEKKCPTCGTLHKKQGPYCSQSCGNVRTFTAKQREEISKQRTEYMNAPEQAELRDQSRDAIAIARLSVKYGHNEITKLDDYYLEPVKERDGFVEDGDYWTEVD